MRRSLLLIVSLLLVWGMAGCAVARKPAPPEQPRTVVIPETTRVSFERVDLARAPDAVKDVAKALENTDASTWVRAGNDLYLLLSMSPRSREYRAEITEIRQRNPRADFSWLDVQVRYARLAPGETAPTAPVFTVVRVGRLDRPVSGVAFEFNREKGPGPAPMPPAGPHAAAKRAPAGAPETTPQEGGEARIDEPAPGRETTSPVKVVGRARHPAREVQVRLVEEGGRILAEKTITVGRDTFTDFETSLSYGPPASPKEGFVEIVAFTGGKEQSLARVPVILK